MRFISNKKDLKNDYIYEIRDYRKQKFIILNILETIISVVDITDLNNKLVFHENVVSCVKETDLNFDEHSSYAFYEMGHKDLYPEYFL